MCISCCQKFLQWSIGIWKVLDQRWAPGFRSRNEGTSLTWNFPSCSQIRSPIINSINENPFLKCSSLFIRNNWFRKTRRNVLRDPKKCKESWVIQKTQQFEHGNAGSKRLLHRFAKKGRISWRKRRFSLRKEIIHQLRKVPQINLQTSQPRIVRIWWGKELLKKPYPNQRERNVIFYDISS